MRPWQWLRAAWRYLNGDAAYDRYCAHVARNHPGCPLPDRGAFHRGEVERRWNGVKRCC